MGCRAMVIIIIISKICELHHLTPKYINIKANGSNRQILPYGSILSAYVLP